ncbi:MAG: corrinoid protein [Phycisphaerales bacterium]|nr:MAG: corrinoid protein [Phycisphaerales bacterium]
MSVLAEIKDGLVCGDDERVSELTQQAIEQGLSPQEILSESLIGGMTIVGERFKEHEIFLPDVLLAAKAMHAGMEVLRPLLIDAGIPSIGKVVLGSVQGDLHDIGKNLVGILLKGAGFEVIDLGNDVAPQSFVDAAKERGASVIGMSALLTTTMPTMAKVVDLVKERKLDSRIKTIVGGAPVSEMFAREIGADAYGFDAANAVDRVKSLTTA